MDTARTVAIAMHFEEQAKWCEGMQSPFTAGLCRAMRTDLIEDGIIAELVEGWSTDPRVDALVLRLTGCLHAAAQSGDPMLAPIWAQASSNPAMATVWPAARDWFAANEVRARNFIQSPPQTNEIRRCVPLAAGMQAIAARFGPDMHILELGASAGLNMLWDRYGIDAGAFQRAGVDPVLPSNWSGDPPPDAWCNVLTRAACDQSPIDLEGPEQRNRLIGYLWADQTDRIERTLSAIALARVQGIAPEKADAAVWLKERLEQRSMDAPTVVYHSVFFQYPPKETRAAIRAMMDEAGHKATREAPLIWLRMEPEAVLVPDVAADSIRMVLDTVTWDGSGAPGERTLLAVVDPHGREVEWLA
jgi:hypothetical protein